ncbi:hypothetical protein BDR07DRAFT_1371564 [Suillus spraguei]|nr:hypothetical protein BDR07DRAFT_1371564 [Suillus spraguei]
MSYFVTYEPQLVRECKVRRLKQKRFWAAGVNNMFAVDQYNKWLRNPQLILSYYLDTIMELSHEFWTYHFYYYDPTLQGTLQHCWMCTKKNVMPKITWSQLQHQFTPGFKTLLNQGVVEGWYDAGNTLYMMIFHWVFIPWLQQELNAYRDQVNNSAKRRDHNKVLLHGVPNLIYNSPKDFSALDFKVSIDHEGIDYVCNFYIDASKPLFDIVPPMLGDFIEHCYNQMGHPKVTCSSVWTVYKDILSGIQLTENPHFNLNLLLMEKRNTTGSTLPLLSSHADLPFNEESDGIYYMGDALADLDEPNVPLDDPIVDQTGVDHTALIIWQFSDDNELDNDDIADEW